VADNQQKKGPRAGRDDPGRSQVVSRIRIIGVDALKKKDTPITGLELNVEIEDVKQNKNFLEIWFVYRVIYKEDVGHITLKGILLLQSEEESLRRAADFYRKNNYFDSPWAENIANNINFKCSTEAIFPSKMIDLPPPIMPPRISMAGLPDTARSTKAAPAAGPAETHEPPQEQKLKGAPPPAGKQPPAKGFPPFAPPSPFDNPFKKH